MPVDHRRVRVSNNNDRKGYNSAQVQQKQHTKCDAHGGRPHWGRSVHNKGTTSVKAGVWPAVPSTVTFIIRTRELCAHAII